MAVLHEEVRQQVIDTGNEMLRSSLVVGTWGNISARVPGTDLVAITPSGVDYDTIEPADIVLVNLRGEIVDGDKKPSIEVPLHLAIYNARPELHAVVHTHSTYVTAFALARKGIPGAAEDLVQIVGGDVRVSEYVLPGSAQLGINVVKAMEDRQAVIMANHGCVAAGRTLKEALKVAFVVEKSAKATTMAKMLGGVVELTQEDIDFMRNFFLNQYGQR